MDSKTTLTNVSFDYLHSSAPFLNHLLNNLTSCVLLLDNEMKLQAFNEPLKTLFSHSKKGDILYKKCGNVLGCAYAVEENKECGETSFCDACKLRESALLSYTTQKPVRKQRLDREFYLSDGTKEVKYLAFSTNFFKYENDNYLMMIVDDISFIDEMRIGNYES